MDKKLTFEEALEKYIARLNREIPEESGTYNKFCPNCYYRNGHPLTWCYSCGTKMIVYTEVPVKITWNQYILKAKSVYQMQERLCEFVHRFALISKTWNAQKDNDKVNYPFVWYVKDPKCTTIDFLRGIGGYLRLPVEDIIEDFKK